MFSISLDRCVIMPHFPKLINFNIYGHKNFLWKWFCYCRTVRKIVWTGENSKFYRNLVGKICVSLKRLIPIISSENEINVSFFSHVPTELSGLLLFFGKKVSGERWVNLVKIGEWCFIKSNISPFPTSFCLDAKVPKDQGIFKAASLNLVNKFDE